MLSETFDLLVELGATTKLSTFRTSSPVVVKATRRTIQPKKGGDVRPLLDLVLEKIPGPMFVLTIRCS